MSLFLFVIFMIGIGLLIHFVFENYLKPECITCTNSQLKEALQNSDSASQSVSECLDELYQ